MVSDVAVDTATPRARAGRGVAFYTPIHNDTDEYDDSKVPTGAGYWSSADHVDLTNQNSSVIYLQSNAGSLVYNPQNPSAQPLLLLLN